jgi:UDPglucose 6-dehydrogenase
MKITIIGTGYVGLVSGTCFAETGNNVMCIDIDEKKIETLKSGKLPIYEPGLLELVQRNASEGRLTFSTDIAEGIKHGDVIFCAVGTPPKKDHRADLQYVESVAKSFGKNIDGYKIIVNKSTVPVGTGDICQKIIDAQLKKRKSTCEYDIVSNPEFLREGAAINDTMKPERIVIGVETGRAKKIMEKLYAPFLRYGSSIVWTNIKSAEVIKYACNSFLATKISFINEVANFCEIVGADIQDVAKGMGTDSRIGQRFLHAGIGYGGSCFPKDVQALIQTGRQHNHAFKILEATEEVNAGQKKKLFRILEDIFPDMEGKKIAVFGLSFKPKTDDMRDAPSIKIVKRLQAEGARVHVFDPVAMENAKHYLSSTNITYEKSVYSAAKEADAVLIVTEWDEFRNIDLDRLQSEMKGDIVVDGRNVFDPQEMKEKGFQYFSIGRGKIITNDE